LIVLLFPRECYLCEFKVAEPQEEAIPRVRLTKSTIDNLPVLEKDTVYWDAGLPGFGVKVTPKGRKVFLVLYRLAGAGSRLRKYTIGPYGRLTLPMAKAQAQKIFAARLDSRDPAEEKKQSRRRMVVDRVDDLVEAFIRKHVAKIGTHRRTTSLLRRGVGLNGQRRWLRRRSSPRNTYPLVHKQKLAIEVLSPSAWLLIAATDLKNSARDRLWAGRPKA